jgi:uncharacterized membrane protein
MQEPIQQTDQTDANNNKAMAILAYIIFFLPLIAAKDSKFAMYHANQGLILFISALAINVIGSFVPILGWFIILPFGNLAVMILAILGIIAAAKGESKPLPLIGSFKIIT